MATAVLAGVRAYVDFSGEGAIDEGGVAGGENHADDPLESAGFA